mmetsp:Transcript_49240/g.157697  ORF Transcript_49240/g.157697 Transcript_49240/m.157697 type:complete len:177 (+) Transcript_49240:524-1054(+)
MADYSGLTNGHCALPFSILGPKQIKTKTSVTLWVPEASKVTLYCVKHKKKLVQLKALEAGVFTGEFKTPKEDDFTYEVHAEFASGEHRYVDPYQFHAEAYHAVHFVDHQPENLYQQIGAQLTESKGVQGIRFAVFAPNASSVSLIGDFNIWNRLSHPMQKNGFGLLGFVCTGLKSR